MVEIEGEPAFPIYVVRMKWHDPIESRGDVSNLGGEIWFKGLPPGRVSNGSAPDVLLREELPLEGVARQAARRYLPGFQEYPDMPDFTPCRIPAA